MPEIKTFLLIAQGERSKSRTDCHEVAGLYAVLETTFLYFVACDTSAKVSLQYRDIFWWNAAIPIQRYRYFVML